MRDGQKLHLDGSHLPPAGCCSALQLILDQLFQPLHCGRGIEMSDICM